MARILFITIYFIFNLYSFTSDDSDNTSIKTNKVNSKHKKLLNLNLANNKGALKKDSALDEKFIGSRITEQQIKKLKSIRSRSEVEAEIGVGLMNYKYKAYYIFQSKKRSKNNIYILEVFYDEDNNKTKHVFKSKSLSSLSLEFFYKFPALQSDLSYWDRLPNKIIGGLYAMA